MAESVAQDSNIKGDVTFLGNASMGYYCGPYSFLY